VWTVSLLKLVAIWREQDQKAPAECSELHKLWRNLLSKQRKSGCRKKDVAAHCCVSGIAAECKACYLLENPHYTKGLLGRDKRTHSQVGYNFC